MSLDGYEVAQRMGLEAFLDIQGDDGTALFLEDGRILKLTGSPSEPALAIALRDLQIAGRSHPSVPWIHDVRWFDDEVDVSQIMPKIGTMPLRRYAIVRDDFHEFETEEEIWDNETWRAALADLAFGWSRNSMMHIERARERWAPRGTEIDDILDGLRWIEANTGVRVNDVRHSNLGVSPKGRVGMRDLGRGSFPDAILDLVWRPDIETLPKRALTPTP